MNTGNPTDDSYSLGKYCTPAWYKGLGGGREVQTWILCIKFLVHSLGLMLWLNFTLLLIFSVRFEKRKKNNKK